MQIVLLDTDIHNHFLPLSYTRSLAEIRIGILTIHEKWKHYTGKQAAIKTKNYLQKKYGYTFLNEQNDFLIINSALLPDQQIYVAVMNLTKGESLYKNGNWLASYTGNELKIPDNDIKKEYPNEVNILNNLWNIFQYNETELKKDYLLLTQNKKSQPLPQSNTLITDGNYDVFLEEGVTIEACILNTKQGPIYLGKNSEIMEGSMLRGPIAI
jgi:hypothetical protein